MLDQLLPQSPEKSLDVGQLSAGLSDLLVAGSPANTGEAVASEDFQKSLKLLAWRYPSGIRLQGLPQVLAERPPISNATTCQADGQSWALSHRLFDRPQAQVLSFIEFKDIVLISWPEPIGY